MKHTMPDCKGCEHTVEEVCIGALLNVGFTWAERALMMLFQTHEGASIKVEELLALSKDEDEMLLALCHLMQRGIVKPSDKEDVEEIAAVLRERKGRLHARLEVLRG